MPVYQDVPLVILVLACAALLPILSRLVPVFIFPLIKFGLTDISKWLKFWRASFIGEVYYSSPSLAQTAIMNFLEVALLGVMFVLIARLLKRTLRFSNAILAIGPPCIAMSILASLTKGFTVLLMSIAHWNPPELVYYVVVSGHVIGLGACAGLAAAIVSELHWVLGVIAAVTACAVLLLWQIANGIIQLWLL